jgi:hypothetical protein
VLGAQVINPAGKPVKDQLAAEAELTCRARQD